MNRQGRPLIFADKNWGLAEEELPETVIRAGCLQAASP
jgi:hypothetical protein